MFHVNVPFLYALKTLEFSGGIEMTHWHVMGKNRFFTETNVTAFMKSSHSKNFESFLEKKVMLSALF